MARPKRGSPQDYEAKEQKAVIEWAQLEPLGVLPGKIGDYIFAVPNGGYGLSPALGAKMKAMGLKAGVSDLCLPVPSGIYHGLFLEMKKQHMHFQYPSLVKAAYKENQLEWQERMQLAGYKAEFAFGAGEAIDIIQEYIRHGR
jgi:hypothetical protein